MATRRERRESGPEGWRLKLLMDAIGNALGTGIAAASALVYGAATGILHPDPRVPVATAILLGAVLWSLVLWNVPFWLEALRESGRHPRVPRIPAFVVWFLGQFVAYLVFLVILAGTDNNTGFAIWAVVFGFAIVVMLEFLDILHRSGASNETE